jgi:hypothetical protein
VETARMRQGSRRIVALVLAATLVGSVGATVGGTFDMNPAYAAQTPTTDGETKAPKSTTMLGRLHGYAWNTGEGGATKKECQGYADAINGIGAREERKFDAGKPPTPGAGETMNGLYEAGKARGCTFLAD